MHRERLFRTARETLLWLGAVLGCGTLVFAAACWIFSLTPLVFTSGSMAPAYASGDLAIAVEVDAADIEVGDVLSVFDARDHRVTHRVVGVERDGDQAVLTMKGDDNPVADQATYRVTTADRVLFGIPRAGYVLRWLAGPFGMLLAGAVVMAVLFILIRGAGPGAGPGAADKDPGPGGKRRVKGGARHRSVAREGTLAVVVIGAVGISGATIPVTGTSAAWNDSAVAASAFLGTTNLRSPVNVDCTGGGVGALPTYVWSPAAAPSAPATEYSVRWTRLSGIGGSAGGETARFTGTSWQLPSNLAAVGVVYQVEVRAFLNNWESPYVVAEERVQITLGLLGVNVSSCTTGGGAPSYTSPFSGGQSTTNVEVLSWEITGPASSCANLKVTTTRSTPAAWSVVVDRSLPPYNGASADLWSSSNGGQHVSFTHSGTTSTIRGNSPNNNLPTSLIGGTSTLDKIRVCTANEGYPAPSDPGFYTVTQSQGTGSNWTDTRACITTTVTATVDTADYPFYFGWTTSVDLTSAKQRITSAGKTLNYVGWDPSPQDYSYVTNPASYQSTANDTVTLTSRRDGSLRKGSGAGTQTSYTFTACVYGY